MWRWLRAPEPAPRSSLAGSGGDVWVAHAPVAEPGRVLPLEGQRLGVVELQPGAALGPRAVEDHDGLLGLPPRHGAARVGAVALDQLRVAVDGVQELVQQVLAHASTPFGYQVK